MASENFDLSLDDIIKKNQQSKRLNRGNKANGGGQRNPNINTNKGQVNAFPKRRGNFTNQGAIQRRPNLVPYARPVIIPDVWQHDLFDPKFVTKAPQVFDPSFGKRGAVLRISNLDYGVSDNDMKELFCEFGPLKRAEVHYDRSGRSLGSAEIEFENQVDALKAMKQYNRVPLDGKPMDITLLGSGDAAVALIHTIAGRLGKRPSNAGPSIFGTNPSRNIFSNAGGRGARKFRGRGGMNNSGGRNNNNQGGGNMRNLPGKQNNKAKPLTKEELDAQLDEYSSKMDEN